MGTDVHAVFQAKKGDGWKTIESKWDQRRHYFLFSWLADVRNGYGFAGVPTYAPIKPIADQRGLPPGFDPSSDEHDLGDHSFSWLTADEILAAPTPDRVWRTGVVPREFFDAWDGHTPPEAWSGDIAGGGVVVAPSPTNVTPESTHVRIWWMQPGDSLKYFTDEIQRLKDEHGEVRMVFGFDS